LSYLLQSELEGACAPVPHSWQRHCSRYISGFGQ